MIKEIVAGGLILGMSVEGFHTAETVTGIFYNEHTHNEYPTTPLGQMIVAESTASSHVSSSAVISSDQF